MNRHVTPPTAPRAKFTDPDLTATGETRAEVPLTGLSMASSGNYRNFYVMDGRVVGHTIDPRTARPVEVHDARIHRTLDESPIGLTEEQVVRILVRERRHESD